MKKIKVLSIVNRFNLGGTTYNVGYLNGYLGDQFETLLIGGEKEDSEESSLYMLEDLGVKPLIVKEMKRSVNPFKDVFAFFKIVKIIKEFKPDIVHTHTAKAGALGRLAAKYCGVRNIYHTFHGHVFHSYFSPLKTKIYIIIERFFAKLSTGIVAISDLQKKELVKVFKIAPKHKVHVVHYGFNLKQFTVDQEELRAYFRKKYSIQEKEVVVGIVGRLVPIKNHALLLEAISKVKTQTNTPFRLMIIGDGELKEELKLYCNNLGLPCAEGSGNSELVTFTSWIKNIEEAYAGIDIVALTSLNEGTPVSLIEAQAAFRPIVTTDVGGVKDVVIPGETALVSPSKEVNALASNLLLLIEHKQKRDLLSKNGLAFVEQNFSNELLISNMVNLYQRNYR